MTDEQKIDESKEAPRVQSLRRWAIEHAVRVGPHVTGAMSQGDVSISKLAREIEKFVREG